MSTSLLLFRNNIRDEIILDLIEGNKTINQFIDLAKDESEYFRRLIEYTYNSNTNECTFFGQIFQKEKQKLDIYYICKPISEKDAKEKPIVLTSNVDMAFPYVRLKDGQRSADIFISLSECNKLFNPGKICWKLDKFMTINNVQIINRTSLYDIPENIPNLTSVVGSIPQCEKTDINIYKVTSEFGFSDISTSINCKSSLASGGGAPLASDRGTAAASGGGAPLASDRGTSLASGRGAAAASGEGDPLASGRGATAEEYIPILVPNIQEKRYYTLNELFDLYGSIIYSILLKLEQNPPSLVKIWERNKPIEKNTLINKLESYKSRIQFVIKLLSSETSTVAELFENPDFLNLLPSDYKTIIDKDIDKITLQTNLVSFISYIDIVIQGTKSSSSNKYLKYKQKYYNLYNKLYID